MKKIVLILFISVVLRPLLYSQVPQGDSTFTSLSKALNHPQKVKVLDLRGKRLVCLPSGIGKMINLEIILLSSKLRNLKLYPPAWPYLNGKKNLPGGGYAHLQGRGVGKFFIGNNLKNLPKEILGLKNLKKIDLRHNPIDGKYWSTLLKKEIPGISVMYDGD